MNLIEKAEKVIHELISEAKYMDGFLKEEVTKKVYREKKERQLSVLNELIEELKNTESETIFLEVPNVTPTLHTLKLENREEMTIRKIFGMHGKEAARSESIRRANDFMEYQEEKYGQKSLQ
jgi:heme oxygenase